MTIDTPVEPAGEQGVLHLPASILPPPDPAPRPGEDPHTAFHRRSALPRPHSLCTYCTTPTEETR